MMRMVVAGAPFGFLMGYLYDLTNWEPWAIWFAVGWALVISDSARST